jgi:hypothetical protein
VVTARERVWKQMVQMFGPQWIEKWGSTNEAWDAALKDLTYTQVSHGLQQVLRGRLKYYEVDLPNFINLCRPAAPIELRKAMTPAPIDWQNGMTQAEIDMNCWANKFMLGWAAKRKEEVGAEQSRAMWKSCRRICKDFWSMRLELGHDKVPNADLAKALERQWVRDLGAGVSA